MVEMCVVDSKKTTTRVSGLEKKLLNSRSCRVVAPHTTSTMNRPYILVSLFVVVVLLRRPRMRGGVRAVRVSVS